MLISIGLFSFRKSQTGAGEDDTMRSYWLTLHCTTHTQDNAACFLEKGVPVKNLSHGEGVWVNPLKMENLQQKSFFRYFWMKFSTKKLSKMIGTDLVSSLQNIFVGNLAWFSVCMRSHHGWPRGENLWILGPQILGKWHFNPSFLRHRHSVTLWIRLTNLQNSKHNNFIPRTFSAKIPLARVW